MIDRPKVALIAEVGDRVGWGHVSRCVILRRILSQTFDVEVKVVNHEPWENLGLAAEFALREPIKADVAFVDGLQLRDALNQKVKAGSVVSLSYMSDLNEAADLVVAPALNGMDVPGHFLTDLAAIVCNRPKKMAGLSPRKDGSLTIGLSMGGADVEGLTPVLERALNRAGHRTLTLAKNSNRQTTLSKFLERKLLGKEVDPFPFYALTECDLAVCQGGLSAIEIALLGIPAVIRSRSDFTPAYRFLEVFGCSQRSAGSGISDLVDTISSVCEHADQRTAMTHACRGLESKIDESFWVNLVFELIKKERRHESMPLLRRK